MAHRNSPFRTKVPGNLTYFIAVVGAGLVSFQLAGLFGEGPDIAGKFAEIKYEVCPPLHRSPTAIADVAHGQPCSTEMVDTDERPDGAFGGGIPTAAHTGIEIRPAPITCKPSFHRGTTAAYRSRYLAGLYESSPHLPRLFCCAREL